MVAAIWWPGMLAIVFAAIACALAIGLYIKEKFK